MNSRIPAASPKMKGMLKLSSAEVKLRTVPNTRDGNMSGSVTRAKTRNGLAPQLRAASSSAGSIIATAARQ